MSATRVPRGFASSVGGAVAVVLLLAALVPVSPGRAGGETVEHVAAGVDIVEYRRDGLAVHVARVASDARAEVRAALAADRIGGDRREPTSAVCRREAATICINADFATCPDCREVFGGFARRSIVRRSFHPHHEQFSVTPDGYSSRRPAWRGELRATLRWPAEEPAPPVDPLAPPPPPPEPGREEVRRIPLDALNRVEDTGAELVTADWGAATVPVEGRRELIVAIDTDVPAGVHAAELLELRDSGAVSAGHVAVRLDSQRAHSFWEEWTTTTAPERQLVLDTAPEPLLESVGAHPVLLRDGQRMPLDANDGKVSQRHPRTLVAWTAAGELLLVTIDGRQPGWSRGATLAEATEMLVELGASDGLNLDGGGSTTFVAPCAGGPCVRNRPSDGRERHVPAVLALVVEPRVALDAPPPASEPVATAPTPAPESPSDEATPPAPEPSPPPTDAPPPAPEAHPAPAEGPVAPAPPPEPTPTSTPPSPEARSAPDDVLAPARATGLRASPVRSVSAPPPPSASHGGVMPATVAASSALLAVAYLTARQLARQRRPFG